MTAPSSVDNCNTSQSIQELKYSYGSDKVLNVCVTEFPSKNDMDSQSASSSGSQELGSDENETRNDIKDGSTTSTPWLYIVLIAVGLLLGGGIYSYYKISKNEVYEKDTSIGMDGIEHDQTVGRYHSEPSPSYIRDF